MPLIPIEADEAAVAAITGGLPPEVRTFCDKHGIVDYLEQGVAIEHLEAEIERDPETGEEWVVLRIAVRASEEEVAEARKRYSAEWVASVPWPQRHLICLSCHIL
jgi:hypothetical protein